MDIAALTSGSAATKSAESSGKKLAADFDNFLKLLTTQLANQDPLSPMDSNEFTAQLVRFTQVEQAISQNKKLEELVALQNSSQSMAAVGYIGKTIEAEGDKNNLTDTGAKWSYSIPQESAQTVILVRNSAGNIVYAGTGETLKGDHVFNDKHRISGFWDTPLDSILRTEIMCLLRGLCAEQGMALFGLDATSADPHPVPNWDDTVHEAKEQSADYRFRIVCGCDRWRAYAETLAASVTYANFKGEISRSPDQRDKLSAYTEFHHSMYDYQSRPGN